MEELDFTAKATILVVDDTADNLTLMSNLLKDCYKVKIVNNGEQALKIAASDSPPDLILLDIMMPGMDGYEVCERLKQNPETSNIPVIFLTAKGEMMDERDGLELGAVDYITKPVSPPILMARVKNHLALKATADFLRDQNHFLELEVAKRANDAIASQEMALRNLQLEEAGRMKSEFLANMSHELRTPLNAIIGFSEMLGDGLLGDLSAQQKEAVNDIFTSGSHLLSLINDILDLSKVEAGKMTLELDALQPALLIQASLQVVREQAMAQRLRLVTEIAPNLGSLRLDERKLKQILYNLLSNAVKFTPEGGEVRITARRSTRQPLPDGPFEDFLELVVADTGIGIAMVDQARLFKPFTQIDSTLARRYEGTGLGLAMVKRLAELHGGSVSLESAPNRGSTFTVWLPWRPVEAIAEVADPVSTARSVQDNVLPVAADMPQSGTRQPLALVVEDDAKAAELLRLQLQRNGFRVLHTVSAEAALELAARECPDLVTVDVQLPGMDGWTFIERFKQHPQFSKVPVLVVSIVADKILGLTLGASYVLQKPVSRDELARALTASGFPPTVDGECRSVLVIDDDPKEVKLLGTYLQSTGYRVLTACSWQDGIDLARNKRPDLIVLDLMMPEVSGFEVVEVLKRDPATADIPIVVVTAKDVTDADRSRLDGDVLKVIKKSGLNQGRFIGEVRQAMNGKEA